MAVCNLWQEGDEITASDKVSIENLNTKESLPLCALRDRVDSLEGGTGGSLWQRPGGVEPDIYYYNSDPDFNVGIGTNSPNYRLHVFSRENFDDAAVFESYHNPGRTLTIETAGQQRIIATNDLVISGGSTGQIVLNSGGSETIRLTSGNQVGIGGVVPSNPLTVLGNADITGHLGIGTNSPSVPVDVVVTEGNPAISIFSSLNNVTTQLAHELGYSTLGTTSNHRFVLIVNDSEKVTILPNGNVGIGTTNPSTRLQVAGSINLTGNITLSGTVDGVDVAGHVANTSNPHQVTLDQGYNSGRVITADAGPVDIQGPDGLLVNGPVGIGVTDPVSQLEVSGTIVTDDQIVTGDLQSSNFISGQSGWRLSNDDNGLAEFEHIRARGSLQSTIFEFQSKVVTGGENWVANGSKIIGHVDPDDTLIPVENASTFTVGEILGVKKDDGTGEEWMLVENIFLDNQYGAEGYGYGDASGDGVDGSLRVQRYYSGESTLVTSWTNGSVFGYDTFTSSGSDLTSVIKSGTSGNKGGVSNAIADIIENDVYYVTCFVTVNSGTPPDVNMVNSTIGNGTPWSDYHQLQPGLNSFILKLTEGPPGTQPGYIQVRNPSGTEFDGSITDWRVVQIFDADFDIVGGAGVVAEGNSYDEGQVIVSTGTVGTGYIRNNARTDDQSTPYTDWVQRIGPEIYDLDVIASAGDLTKFAGTAFVLGNTDPQWGFAAKNAFITGGISAAAGDIGGIEITSTGIRTADSGQRIEILSLDNTLSFYNTSGALAVQLDDGANGIGMYLNSNSNGAFFTDCGILNSSAQDHIPISHVNQGSIESILTADAAMTTQRAIAGVLDTNGQNTSSPAAVLGLLSDSTPGNGQEAYAIHGKVNGVAGTAGIEPQFAGYFEGGNVYCGERVGIGTTTPSRTLDVNGDIETTGSIVPSADGLYDLGVQTTAQWANVWSDLINGADFVYENNWRTMEAEKFSGYPKGIAFTSPKINPPRGRIRGKMRGQPTFVVTDDGIEFKGRRITEEILDKLLDLVS